MEFLRGSGHPTARILTDLLERGEEVALTEVIVMELLAGAGAEQLRPLRSRLVAFPLLRLRGLADFEEAAAIYRTCREAGEPPRALSDCLIAVPVIRTGATLLHNDADFEAIARHTSLRTYPLP